MSSISSSNYFNATNGASGNGISGLASGMDTEAMVEKMLSGTQGKIDKQEGLKQQDLWRQEIYRDIIGTINNFSSKYFDSRYGASTANNFASAAFFDSMISSVAKGSVLKILGSSSASVGDMRVQVKQLATNASIASSQRLSKSDIIDSAVLNADRIDQDFGKRVTFTYGTNGTLEIDLSEARTTDDVAAIINQSFAIAGVDARTSVDKGRLSIETGAADLKISVDVAKSTALGLKLTGLTKSVSTEVKDDSDMLTGNRLRGEDPINTQAGYEFTMTLDGVSKLINVKNVKADASGKVTAQTLEEAFAEEVKNAFGGYVKVGLVGNASAGYKLQLGLDVNGEPGHELKLTGSNASKLGFTPGASTRVSMSSTLNSLGAGGDKFKFTVNGKEFSFTGDDTLGSVISKINASDAGVRISYSSMTDTITMETRSTGAKYGIDIKQTEGNLLGVLFGNDKINNSGSMSSTVLTKGEIVGDSYGLPDDYSTKMTALGMTVNGKAYSFVLNPKADGSFYDKTEVMTELNSWLKTTFGSTDDTPNGPANIECVGGTLKIAGGFKVEFAKANLDYSDTDLVAEAGKGNLGIALGFNKEERTNLADATTAISDIPALDGLTILDASGSPAATLGDIKTINNYPVSYADGRLQINGIGSYTFTGTALAKLFGGDSFTLGDGAQQANSIKAGMDAQAIINGVSTSRSSNTFTIDGITMELTSVSPTSTDSSGNVTYEETLISTKRDTDLIVDGFKSFVEDYNKMLDKLGGYMNEEPHFKNYAPLTTEQRKELSDREVELWEEKAKQGLVRRDSDVESFLSEMRLSLYTKPENSKYALYNIGIETTNKSKERGKLQLDETALRNAMASDPDSVKELFTNLTEGLAKKMTTTMEKAAKESSGTPGTLVALAGTTEVLPKKNTIYDRIKGIETRIKDLKYKYERERQRYWNQFSSMESILANFNQQSMMFMNQMGSN